VAWVRTPDELMEREEVFAVGFDALGLHIAALGYSNRNLTDGRIPATKAAILVPLPDAGILIDRLVAAGWWTVTEAGYQLVYLLDLQPTAESVLAKRAATARRVSEHRDRRNGVSNAAGTHAVTALPGTRSRSPDPDPVPGPALAVVAPSSSPPGRKREAAASRQDGSLPSAPRAKISTATQKRIAQIVDLVRDDGVPIHVTSRDGGVLKSCAAPAELIAAAYVAAARGEWDPGGDRFLLSNLSLHAVIDRLAGYQVDGGLYGVPFVSARLAPLMRGPGHNVHGPSCDCRPIDAAAEVAF
jgi:hypothetical protein